MTTKTDVMVKLVLVFFISLLSFSIGTFVGKKYSDNQHKLAALEPAHGATREVASEHGDEHGKAAMSDDDIAKIAEEFADEETVATKTGEHGEEQGEDKAEAKHGEVAKHGAEKEEAHGKPEAKGAVAKSEVHKPEEPSQPAKNLIAGKAPSESMAQKAHAETRLPSSLPKDVAQYSVGKFTVQVAAFNNEGEAKKRATDLKDKGYSAFYVPANVKGKTWYRVSVGLFATEKEAKDFKVDFVNRSKNGNVIVQKITN